jgi:ATP-dependent DNA helicase RecQ
VAKVATGSREQKVRAWRFEEISTYGLLGKAGFTSGEANDLLAALAAYGAIDEEYVTRAVGPRDRTYREVRLNELSWSLMRRQAPDFTMVFPHASKLVRSSPKAGGSLSEQGVPSDLFALLRDVRRQLADQKNVPAYVIAPDRTLKDMARVRPLTKGAMLGVHGMGKRRWELYGSHFLEAIRAYAAG